MTGELFFELLQDLDDEILLCGEKADAGDRIERSPEEKKRIKRTFTRWLTVAACAVVMISVLLTTPTAMSLLYYGTSHPDGEAIVNADGILWQSGGSDEPSIVSSVNDYGGVDYNVPLLLPWGNWNVTYNLRETLEKADLDVYIAILVQRNSREDFLQFEYEGKTYYELIDEQKAEKVRREMLLAFQEDAEYLKYGEALYRTGTPDGVKWTKEQYYDTVTYYGEDLLAAYIRNGEVAYDLLNADLSACKEAYNTVTEKLNEIEDAYQRSYAEEDERRFSDAGVCTVLKDGRLYLFIKKNHLKRLRLSNSSVYRLCLASSDTFEQDVTAYSA